MRRPKRCKFCQDDSLRGLIPGQERCMYHYCEYMWGKAWAERVKKEDEEEANGVPQQVIHRRRRKH